MWLLICRTGPRMRTAALVFLFLGGLSLCNLTLAENKDQARIDVIYGYKTTAQADAKALALATSSGEATTAAFGFAKKTDDAFAKLKTLGLSDRKLLVYEEYWGGLIKPRLQDDPQNAYTTIKVGAFPEELFRAAKGGLCTLVVSASRGEGATVHYAKAHDAQLGRSFRQLAGTTTIIQEIEKAEYVLKCIRNGKETGKTGVIACLDSKTPVKVVIEE